MNRQPRQRRGRPGRRGAGLIIAIILGPVLAWGQGNQRAPVELKTKLADGRVKIGHTFVESLKDRIERSATFRLSRTAIPRLVLHIASEDLPGDPYQAVITVVRTVAVPWKGGTREIFVDNLMMVGVSAAHSGRDAADILEDTRMKILPAFTAIKGEGN
jgi:hypothetical protein